MTAVLVNTFEQGAAAPCEIRHHRRVHLSAGNRLICSPSYYATIATLAGENARAQKVVTRALFRSYLTFWR